MPTLITCNTLSKTFGTKNLFNDLSITVSRGDAIGIIGPNGSGKSTLLKMIAGIEDCDEGTIARRKLINVQYLPQVSVYAPKATAHSVVLGAAKEIHDADEIDIRVAKSLSMLGFTDVDVKVETLSGGWKKRLDIACSIVNNPTLILFDEPTNHLDIEGLIWFEKLLKSSSFSWVMVSHDRYFLEKTVNRVIELGKMYPGGCFDTKGSYSEFLEKKAEFLQNSKKVEQSLASKVRREVDWLRHGPKARTGKAKYRIDEANNLIEELSNLRNKMSKTKTDINFSASNKKMKQLVKLENVSKAFGDKKILKDFNFTLCAGLNIGILGMNGIGKSTLLKLINKEITPDSGNIKQAENLKVVYFSQHREALDPNWTLKMALSRDEEAVMFKGQSINITSWAKRFEFQPEQLEFPVSKLSGGEQARVMIARLMTQQADVLLLDEPTNDLDIQTLISLEESLVDFPGTVVLVTHDRCMLNNTCDLFIGFTGDQEVELYSDYTQWEKALSQSKNRTDNSLSTESKSTKNTKKAGITYKEKQDLQKIEHEILELDEQIEKIHGQLIDPNNASDFVALEKLSTELKAAQDEVERLYVYWNALEKKKSASY